MNLSSKMLEPTGLRHLLRGWPPPGPNNFRWEGGCLIYMLPYSAHNRRDWDKMMTPTGAQWDEFWHVCGEIDIWSWPPTLGNMRTIDGVQWHTELQIGARRVISQGQVHGSPPDFEPKLMRLHRTLQAMTGCQPATKD